MEFFGDWKDDTKVSYVRGYKVEDDVLTVNYLARGEVGFPYKKELEDEIVDVLEKQYMEGLARYKTMETDSVKNLELFIGTFMAFVASVPTYIWVQNASVLFFSLITLIVSTISLMRFRALAFAIMDLDKYKTYFENVDLFKTKIELIDETKLYKKLRKYVESKRGKESLNINDVDGISKDDLTYLLSLDNKPYSRVRTKDNE